MMPAPDCLQSFLEQDLIMKPIGQPEEGERNLTFIATLRGELSPQRGWGVPVGQSGMARMQSSSTQSSSDNSVSAVLAMADSALIDRTVTSEIGDTPSTTPAASPRQKKVNIAPKSDTLPPPSIESPSLAMSLSMREQLIEKERAAFEGRQNSVVTETAMQTSPPREPLMSPPARPFASLNGPPHVRPKIPELSFNRRRESDKEKKDDSIRRHDILRMFTRDSSRRRRLAAGSEDSEGSMLSGSRGRHSSSRRRRDFAESETTSLPDPHFPSRQSSTTSSGATLIVSDRHSLESIEYTFETVIIKKGGTLTTSAWNGSSGGTMRIRTNLFIVEEGATVLLSGLGFRGGNGVDPNNPFDSQQGECVNGFGTYGAGPNGGGGGGGTGSEKRGAGGGGGAGGMHPGFNGKKGGGVGGEEESGGMGCGGGAGHPLAPCLSSDSSSAESACTDETVRIAGGAGGGLLVINADDFRNHGSIQSNGLNGDDAPTSGTSGAGGGAGGTISITASSINNSGSIQAKGGKGGQTPSFAVSLKSGDHSLTHIASGGDASDGCVQITSVKTRH